MDVGVQLRALVEVLGAVVHVVVDAEDGRSENLGCPGDLLRLDQGPVHRLAQLVFVDPAGGAVPVGVVALALPQLVLRGLLLVLVPADLVHQDVGVHHFRVHQPRLRVAAEEVPEMSADEKPAIPRWIRSPCSPRALESFAPRGGKGAAHDFQG